MELNKFSSSFSSIIGILAVSFLSFKFCTAGFVIESYGSKIFGGAVAADKAFPFQVYIEIPSPVEQGTFASCSGSIIKHLDNRYKILTAAHCFDILSPVDNRPGNKDVLITVVMGANNIATQRNRGKVYRIKSALVRIHPDYNIDTLANDLAIIPLPDDFKPVPGLYDAINLPPPGDVDRNYAGTTVQIAGWGVYNGQGRGSDQLLFIQTKILDDDACNKAEVQSGLPGDYNTNLLCIDGTGEKGACEGDSGSPLITIGRPSVILGVSSYGLTKDCKGSVPFFLVRVVKYLPWINSTI